MRHRKLDNNADMTFGASERNFFVDDINGVAQSVLTRLRLWVGEWFLNTSAGTPYSQAMLGTNKQDTIAPAMRERILGTPGVTEIVTFELLKNETTRAVTILATINTQFGTTTVTGIV
jgi:hypothetical protein